MSTFDYRVVEDQWGSFSIHEVYYKEDGTIEAVFSEPEPPFGRNLEELKDDIELFLKALDLPVIKLAELGELGLLDNF